MRCSKKDVCDIVFNVLTSRMGSNITYPRISLLYDLIDDVTDIFEKEKNILQLDGSFIVVGDIHGNVDDLIRIFEMRGYPPETNYLFLGDYVDRGEHSIEVLLLLYSFKFLFPNNFFMIRGNHENAQVSTFYGFRAECSKKYSQKIFYRFNESFNYLSFAAIMNSKIFCVHGGISPDTMNLKEFNKIEKPIDNDASKAITGLVWSDPLKTARGFMKSDRGVGFFFNEKKLRVFLRRNNLESILRSHEACDNGIEYPLKNCVTIFSNTDYCDMNNEAAIAFCTKDAKTQYIKFKPLTQNEKKKRIVIYPEWLLTSNSESPVMKEPTYPIDELSLSSNISVS